MLGKLLKYEYKETAKLFIPLNAIVLLITLLWTGYLKISLYDANGQGVLQVFFILLYVIGILALFIITGVYLAIRFYKTMYAQQGYLTHTLPVSVSATLNSKIIAAVSWLLLAILVCAASILILALGLSGLPSSADMQRFQEYFCLMFGMELLPSIGIVALMLIGFCFELTMMVYASLSVGQLFHNYRIPAAIGAGVVFYVIQQIVSALSLFAVGIGYMGYQTVTFSTTAPQLPESDLYRHIFLTTLTLALLFSIAYYVICHILTKKKLNLE